jgi:hypothetical protein
MQTGVPQTLMFDEDRDRLKVENYKKHFKAMKARLKAFSENTYMDAQANKENHDVIQYNMKKIQTIEENGLNFVKEIRNNLKEDTQYSPRQAKFAVKNIKNSSANSHKNSCEIFESNFQASHMNRGLNLEHLSRNESECTERLIHFPVDQQQNQGIEEKIENNGQFPLVSFRAPFPLKDGQGGAQSNQLCVFKSVESKASITDCKSSRQVSKSPNMLKAILASPIHSPPQEKATKNMPKAKKRIVIDLVSPSRQGPKNFSERASSGRKKQGSLNLSALNAEQSLNFDQKLEEIKLKALRDDFGESCQPRGVTGVGPQSFSKHFELKAEEKYEIQSKTNNTILKGKQEGRFIQTGRGGYCLMARSKSFFVDCMNPKAINSVPRKRSEKNLLCSNDVWNKLSKRRSRGLITCQTSVDSTKNQETPSFHKLSLSRRKKTVSAFTNSFLVSPSQNWQKESVGQPSSRRESVDQRSTSRSQMRPRPMAGRSPLKSGSRAVSPLFAEQPPAPKVALVELMGRLAKGERARVEKAEMLKLTKRNFARLPEVVEREKSRKALAGLKEKALRIKEYDLVCSVHQDGQERVQKIRC